MFGFKGLFQRFFVSLLLLLCMYINVYANGLRMNKGELVSRFGETELVQLNEARLLSHTVKAKITEDGDNTPDDADAKSEEADAKTEEVDASDESADAGEKDTEPAEKVESDETASEAKEGEEAKEGAEGKVNEGAEAKEGEEKSSEGVVMKPAPGMPDPAVTVRTRDNFMEDVQSTTDFIGSHSFKQDIASLLSEVDASENAIKGLKLHIVEKENFIDSLIKREDILQADLNMDKGAVDGYQSHIKSLKARIERMKKEKQLRLLEAQFHEYAAAASKVRTEADDLASVKQALFSKMHYLNDVIKPLHEAEDVNMRLSIAADTEGKLEPDELFDDDDDKKDSTTVAPTEAPAA